MKKEVSGIRYQLQTISFYLIVFGILMSDTVMWKYLEFCPFADVGFVRITMVFCGISYLLGGIRVNRKLVRFGLVAAVFLAVYIVETQYDVLAYLSNYYCLFLCMLVFCFGLIETGRFRDFLKAYSNVIVILALSSLIIWSLGSCLDLLPGKIPARYIWASRNRLCYNYYNIYFEVLTQELNINGVYVVRNTGVFTEAPGFATVLIYALGIELYAFRENRNYRRIGLLALTLITTISTKGLLALVLILVMELFVTNWERVKQHPIVSICVVEACNLAVAGMLFLKSDSYSWKLRVDDVFAALKTWKDHILFGVGYRNIDEIMPYTKITRTSGGITMGITVLLAEGGIWLASAYVGAAVCALKSRILKPHRKEVIMFGILLMVEFAISNVAFSVPVVTCLGAAFASVLVDRQPEENLQITEGAANE